MVRASLFSLILLLSTVGANAAPTCQEAFQTRNKSEIRQQGRVQADELLVRFINPAAQPRNSLRARLARWQERRLVQNAKYERFGDRVYRDHFIRRLITLRLRSQIDPFTEFQISRDARKNEQINSLIANSLLENGLRDWALARANDWSPGTARRIIRNPLFRAVVLWEVPRRIPVGSTWIPGEGIRLNYWDLPDRRIRFTERQVEQILEHGNEAFKLDPELKEIADEYRRAGLIHKLNLRISSILSVALSINSGVQAYEHLQANAAQAQAEANRVATDNYVRETSQALSQASGYAEQAVLDLARENVRIVETRFREVYGTEPTAEEKQQIRESICIQSMGDALGEAARRTCIAI